jgi:ubiquinol-cytochrome c reductase cytochrome b subunit
MRYRPTARWFFFIFVVVTFGLGYCGANPPDQPVIPGDIGFQLGDSNINSFVWLSRVLTAYYFLYFLAIVPITAAREKTLPVPDSISTPVLAAAPAE